MKLRNINDYRCFTGRGDKWKMLINEIELLRRGVTMLVYCVVASKRSVFATSYTRQKSLDRVSRRRCYCFLIVFNKAKSIVSCYYRAYIVSRLSFFGSI